jgi:hypothetical protein
MLAGAIDPNWTVTYASTNGGRTINHNFIGSAITIDPNALAGNGLASGWINNTSTAQWITAPNAEWSNNGGGYYDLPGNGTGKNSGTYIYTLVFNIEGDNPGSIVTNDISISLTIAADDQWKLFLNPKGDGTKKPNQRSVIEFDDTQAWLNTTSVTLDNFLLNNALFVIGQNYLCIEVTNTNDANGNSNQMVWNPSGMFLYQSSADWTRIDGRQITPVPEPSAYGLIFIGSSLGLYFFRRFRKKI